MQLVHPPLTVVAATISALLAGSVLAATPGSQDAALADETLTVLGQTYRNTATKTRLDPIETPQAISVVDSETLEQREAGQTNVVIASQLAPVLELVGAAGFAKAVVAYEPVWAIGTGRTATKEQAQQVHAFIRGEVARIDARIADSLPIVYGGSVKPDNAGELFAQPDVDGGLVGGASLVAADFLAIARAAAAN